jgi:hypothetical protein
MADIRSDRTSLPLARHCTDHEQCFGNMVTDTLAARWFMPDPVCAYGFWLSEWSDREAHLKGVILYGTQYDAARCFRR